MTTTPHTFQALGHTLTLELDRYSLNDRLAISLFDDEGEPCTTLTCNLPDENLEEGEFFIKTWFPNEEITVAALESGLFVDTGKRVETGFVQAPVWRFK